MVSTVAAEHPLHYDDDEWTGHYHHHHGGYEHDDDYRDGSFGRGDRDGSFSNGYGDHRPDHDDRSDCGYDHGDGDSYGYGHGYPMTMITAPRVPRKNIFHSNVHMQTRTMGRKYATETLLFSRCIRSRA
ncbi:unnamed protein product [Victoria cruziana]